MSLPEYLSQGEIARLFPVLSTTSKEGRTTSIVLACVARIQELGRDLLASAGCRVGKRSRVTTYVEPVFHGQPDGAKARPDGLIVVENGGRQWRALVEAKVGAAELVADQIETYRALARHTGVDCVISISNDFATSSQHHPLEAIRKSRSRVPVYHWSWMSILTTADLLLTRNEVQDSDQAILLNELRRFLTHESAGVRGFDRMPPGWGAVNKLVSAGGQIPAKSQDAQAVIGAWHQETRDLSLILSRQTETLVLERMPKRYKSNLSERVKNDLAELRNLQRLTAAFEIEDAAAPLELVADIPRRTLEIGMSLKAPLDRKSSKARANWLLRQVTAESAADIFVRMQWPGRSEDTIFPLEQLRCDVSVCEVGKAGLQVHGFHVFLARRLGAKFTQQANFISELEAAVPEFYREVGQYLSVWQKPAATIKTDRSDAGHVSVEAISEDAEESAG